LIVLFDQADLLQVQYTPHNRVPTRHPLEGPAMPPAPIDVSSVFLNAGSINEARAGSATMPTAILVAEMPT
jgi:hypothetical protein